MIGIYKYTNLINGKVYIGQSDNINQRRKAHRNSPFNPNSSTYNCVFYRAIRKYGLENFKFEIIEECSKDKLNERERYWIKYYRSYLGFKDCNGYNMTLGGDSVCARYLLDYEQVQEIQHLLLTTRISQMEISKQFGVSQMTISQINQGVTWVDEELSYPLRTKKQVYYCSDCGKEISKGATRCPECAKIAKRTINRPPKEELQQLLTDNNGNFTAVGRIFGLSDSAIRKWCKGFDLPTHTKDYKQDKPQIQKQQYHPPKAVYMLDKDTEEVLKEFSCYAEAGRFLGIKNATHIGDVANGKRKTAYGYKWKYVE